MRYFYIICVVAVAASFNSCQKINGHFILPASKTTTGTTGSTGTTTGTGSTGNTGGTTGTIDTTKGYLPLTANTYWKYRATSSSTATVDTSTTTVTGNTATFNGLLYTQATVVSKLFGTSQGYYFVGNHAYIVRGTSLINGITTQLELFVDNLPVGGTWTSQVTDIGTINGVPAQLVGYITGINLTKTVSGITFNSVAHTTLHLQYNFGLGFTDNAVYDCYIAKGVGIIENDADLSSSGINLTTSSVIIDYSVK